MPREHGAYMQLAFPMLTYLWVGELTASAALLGISVWCAFVGHEPAAVLLGLRGSRLRREAAARARARLAILGCVAALSAGVACVRAPPLAAISLAVLSVAGGAALLLTKTKKERTLGGQLYLATLLVLASSPIGIAANMEPSSVAIIAAVWILIHLVGTLAARGVALQRRIGPGPVQRAALLATVATVAAASAAFFGVAPWVFAAAILPPALVSIRVALRPPGPEGMREVGLALVGASVLTTLALVAVPI